MLLTFADCGKPALGSSLNKLSCWSGPRTRPARRVVNAAAEKGSRFVC